jgi:hypothetical protein
VWLQYADFHCVRSCNVKKMLAGAGMVFEGRLHSGIDDTRNIARIGAYSGECVPSKSFNLPLFLGLRMTCISSE